MGNNTLDEEIYTTGIETISWVVTAVNLEMREFTILSTNGSQRRLYVPMGKPMNHMMSWIQIWVQAVIHNSQSWPKEIVIYASIADKDERAIKKIKAEIIADSVEYLV